MFQTQIEFEVAKDLTVGEKLGLLQLAYARSPAGKIRTNLATLYLQNDAFDEVIELFADAMDLNFDEAMMLVQAHLARENPVDTAKARDVADRAVELAIDDRDRAAALADRAKAEIRLNERTAARETLQQALQCDAGNMNACKRLAALDLAAGDHAAVLEMVGTLASKGTAHARLFAASGLAHARTGAVEAARAALAFDALSAAQHLPPPEGWTGIESFNAALAVELLAHPGLRYERYGSASELTWRIDSPAMREAPLVSLLLNQIRAALNAHIQRVAPLDHRWARARPKSTILRSWCVITEGDGFETWHVHQFGWLSGVYYVQVPDSIALGDTVGGCLAFGLPADLVGDEAAAAYGTHLVRPRGGLMVTFPSHSYHRTFPHLTGGKRIAFAFDLRPA